MLKLYGSNFEGKITNFAFAMCKYFFHHKEAGLLLKMAA